MLLQSRRAFLGTSLAGLLAGQLAANTLADAVPTATDDAPFQPNTLFLTWQRDPTTTMTVQWIGTQGETADTKISFAELKESKWQTKPTAAKPYPLTDFKVYRC